MKVMSVVGARPQFVKLAPIDRALREAHAEHEILHTGQHYDPLLSKTFFDDLGISEPAYHLNVGSGHHGEQTGAMLIDIEKILLEDRPDWLLVYGDTNSTLAAAVAAVKLQIPLAHLEAGLRSFNRAMPEEHNRVLTDHAADLLLAPSQEAMDQLTREGLAQRSVLVGDVMADVLFAQRDAVAQDPIPVPSSEGEYVIATIHRPQNTDDSVRLTAILEAFERFPKPVFLLAHPRLQNVMKNHGGLVDRGNLHWHDPLPYPQLVRAVMSASAVVTDSGGLQKEAFLLRTPCVTVRTETEWVETVQLGWNQLVEPGEPMIRVIQAEPPKPTHATPYGDGHAAHAVASVLSERLLS
ncbi:MAG: UDP-N-acetylglucosamine 2-epimerase (non-hydrolyzing) [Actinomycetaceae bacterium]|nr:UDP-N-acetylglucosamine 2-epimerase (non-hydrolyzing) [Actinomycetaceae bacterium]MDY5273910.1 UDP-N-acetylglucosamine 2-epimerase (non-hydrolyzing) [Arcanobacterium sp.]